MKKHLGLIVSALLVTSSFSFAGPDSAAIEAKEKEAWQTFKDKDAAGFKKIIDKDFVGVFAQGFTSLESELAEMPKWDVKSFAISDFKMFSDEKDVAMCHYTVKIEGTYGGKDVSGTYNAGSVWKMENGQWLAILHTHVKQEK